MGKYLALWLAAICGQPVMVWAAGSGVVLASGDESWQGMRLTYEMVAGIPHEPGTGKFDLTFSSATIPILPADFSLAPMFTYPDGRLQIKASVTLHAGGDFPVFGWTNSQAGAEQADFRYSYLGYYRPQEGYFNALGAFTPITWLANPALTHQQDPKPYPSLAPFYSWRLDLYGTIPAASAPSFLALVPEPHTGLLLLATVAWLRPARRRFRTWS
jgi:hypothetical protein